MRRAELFGIIVIAGALSACGSDSGSPAPPVEPMQIDSNNAKRVAGDVVETSDSIGGLGDSSGGITTQSVGGGNSTLASLSQRVLLQALQQQSRTISTVVMDEIACDSGTITVTANDVDNNGELSPADTIDATYNQCVEGNESLNGSVSIRDISVTGDIVNQVPPWSIAATFAFNNVVFTQAGETSSINGSFSITLGMPDNTLLNASISANSITVVDSEFTETLSNFSSTASLNTSTLAYSTDTSGTFSSDRFAGSATFDTTQTFGGVGEDFPSEGELLITGANNSSVRLIAIDNVDVRLEVDEDGDGAVDETIDTTWQELDDLA